MHCMLRLTVYVCLLRENIFAQRSAKSVSDFNYLACGAYVMLDKNDGKVCGDIRNNVLHKHSTVLRSKWTKWEHTDR